MRVHSLGRPAIIAPLATAGILTCWIGTAPKYAGFGIGSVSIPSGRVVEGPGTSGQSNEFAAKLGEGSGVQPRNANAIQSGTNNGENASQQVAGPVANVATGAISLQRQAITTTRTKVIPILVALGAIFVSLGAVLLVANTMRRRSRRSEREMFSEQMLDLRSQNLQDLDLRSESKFDPTDSLLPASMESHNLTEPMVVQMVDEDLIRSPKVHSSITQPAEEDLNKHSLDSGGGADLRESVDRNLTSKQLANVKVMPVITSAPVTNPTGSLNTTNKVSTSNKRPKQSKSKAIVEDKSVLKKSQVEADVVAEAREKLRGLDEERPNSVNPDHLVEMRKRVLRSESTAQECFAEASRLRGEAARLRSQAEWSAMRELDAKRTLARHAGRDSINADRALTEVAKFRREAAQLQAQAEFADSRAVEKRKLGLRMLDDANRLRGELSRIVLPQ